MLAKELKIKLMMRQRKCVENSIMRIMEEREDGDPAYTYIGQLFPEVIEYFRDEGFTVQDVSSNELRALTKGYPVYLFMVDPRKTVLTDEERKEAEVYKPVKSETTENPRKEAENVLNRILGL